LLETIVLKGLEASDIQDTNEVGTLQLLDVQSFVGNDDQPGEGARERSLGQRLDRVLTLIHVLSLVDKLGADLDPWLGQTLDQLLLVQAKQARDLLEPLGAVWLGLLLSGPLLPLGVAPVGNGRRDLEQINLLLLGEHQSVKGLLGVQHFLLIVDSVNRQHTCHIIDFVSTKSIIY